MKITRMIGFAVVAALALTALAGASQALAAKTALCKASETTCAASKQYTSGTSLKATSTNMEISAGIFGDIECKESTLEGKTSATSGEPLPAEITAWTLGGCTHGAGHPCTATAEHLPYSASITHTEGSNGTISFFKGSGGEARWSVSGAECGVTCMFSTELSLAVKGGNPATLSASEVAMKHEGGKCPSKSNLNATYTVNWPQPAYVLLGRPPEPEKGLVLCSEYGIHCPEGHAYPYGTEFNASGYATEMSVGIFGTVRCKSTSLEGHTTAEVGEKSLPASISSFSLSGCTRESESCTATSEGLPYTAEFVVNEEGKRFMKAPIKFYMICGNGWINCTFFSYVPGHGIFWMTNGSPATLEIYEEIEHEGKVCPPTTRLKANYQITSPNPLYLIQN